MSGVDLDKIERRWSTYGGMGNPLSADDYTDAGCRIFAEHGFRDVPALVAELRETRAKLAAVRDLHSGAESGPWCLGDDLGYPCETVRILGGTP